MLTALWLVLGLRWGFLLQAQDLAVPLPTVFLLELGCLPGVWLGVIQLKIQQLHKRLLNLEWRDRK